MVRDVDIEKRLPRALQAVSGILATVLLGCSLGHPPPGVPAPPPLDCGGEILGADRLTAPLVLVGEIHGTREIPATFGRLVCQMATEHRGQNVLVGLEILASAQAAIDVFLAGDGGDAAIRTLLAQEFWQRDFQDGRSSQAMLDLLDEFRRLRRAGLKVVVRALDPPRSDSPAARDEAMAAAMVEAMTATRPAHALILVGNVHSRTLNGYPWDPKAAYVPLGAHLRARYSDLIALDILVIGGSAWTCTSAAATDCGAHAMRARDPGGPTPRIVLDSGGSLETGYDGKLVLGPVTASSPARLALQPSQ